MTKSDQIKELLRQGVDYGTIAEKVGVSRPYVRVVKQRMDHGGMRPCDAWLLRSPEVRARRIQAQIEKRRADPEARARHLEAQRRWRQRKKAERQEANP